MTHRNFQKSKGDKVVLSIIQFYFKRYFCLSKVMCYLRKESFFFLSRVIELTGDVTPDMKSIAKADLIVTTPEKWDGVSRSWQNRNYVKQVTILIIDEIHLLGGYRAI